MAPDRGVLDMTRNTAKSNSTTKLMSPRKLPRPASASAVENLRSSGSSTTQPARSRAVSWRALTARRLR